MHITMFPASSNYMTIVHHYYTRPMQLAMFKSSPVNQTHLTNSEQTLSVHVIFFKNPLVCVPTRPNHLPVAFHHPLAKLACIRLTIGPFDLSFTVKLSI